MIRALARRKHSYLIVGAGLSGSVLAERIANVLGEKVLVIDRRNHVGGNCYDYKDEKTGILVHKYGPHAFHTNNEQVWNYLSSFTDWEIYFHRCRAVVDGISIDLPFNLNSVYQVFPPGLAGLIEEKMVKRFGFGARVSIHQLRKEKDGCLRFLADFIFRKVFLGYSAKQWGIEPPELEESVLSRVPILVSRDSRYFQDRYQGIPAKGYTKMVESMLGSENIDVLLGVDFKGMGNRVRYGCLIYTGSIDEFFDCEFGRLPYRSLRFVVKHYSREFFQDVAQTNYPENYEFTRITEFKHFLCGGTSNTVVSFEYPESYEAGKNEPFYPIPARANHRLYEKYARKGRSLRGAFFVGRLGQYKYLNMDEAVWNALCLFDRIRSDR
jgi:UDP-galactopyranose mutase